MNKISSVILFLCLLLFSCENELAKVESNSESVDSQVQSAKTKSGPVEFKELPNPYALEVMQQVYNESGLTGSLTPTHMYIRFLPQDSIQLKQLQYEYNYELFDYPLNIDIPEGVEYVDPNAPEGDFHWMYTTIKLDQNLILPQDIRYESLELCYIPGDDDEAILTPNGELDIEEAAFRKLGYIEDNDATLFSKKVYPRGTIRVYNNATGNLEPLKGVKVRCHRIIKWSTTFTDENGNYVMDSKFRYNPHYAIVFDNAKGFDIWGNWGPLARANYNMGWHSEQGHSREFYNNSTAWEWCAVNNAAYDYYKKCEQTGIPKPPSNLKIWVFKGKSNSSASMMRRINGVINWEIFHINMGGIPFNLIKKVLPDITIGSDNKNYRGIYEVVHHELSHASHFSQVGSSYWTRYINYIIENGAYGNGTAKDAKLCAIGEMWGYSMGYIYENEQYSVIGPNTPYPGGYPETWINPHIFWDLHRDNILTKKQIFDCLTADVDTYDKLVEKMYSKYSDKANDIETAFIRHGITPNVQKPDTGSDGDYDAFYSNKTVSSNYTFLGNNIFSENVTVTNNAILTLKCKQSVTINLPFTVNAGTQFIMTLQ